MKRQPFRMPKGGLIDRSKIVAFTFDGKVYEGHPGDTLASALLANGVRFVGRSFKYHRPRGVLTAGSEEPNALVELRTHGRREPNTRATMVELYSGLAARSQNHWPSLHFDFLGINGLFAPLLVAGFYYKTFKWPPSFWKPVYERFIRRAAGLGQAAASDDPDAYEKTNAHCDVLVIGAGPAGLMAAQAAAASGARVILTDEGARMGGALLRERIELGDEPGPAWVEQTLARLAEYPDVRLMPRTTVWGRYDGGVFTAIERVGDHLAVPAPHAVRQRLWRINAIQAVLASGATERPITFPGNDRPGIMMAGAARTYINQYAVRPGDRAVIFGNSAEIFRTALDLAKAGATVSAMIDTRRSGRSEYEGIPHYQGSCIAATYGYSHVKAVEIAPLKGNGATQRIDCDLVCVTGGWNPNFQLATHLNERPIYDEERACFRMKEWPSGLAIAGAADGLETTADCLGSGIKAGTLAATRAGFTAASISPLDVAEGPIGHMQPCFFADPSDTGNRKDGKAFVDFQNDVSVRDIKLAVQEGYAAAEHAKRYTTLGMATDQGRTGSANGAAILAKAMGADIAQVGITSHRPPYTPVGIGALAGHSVGRDFRPTRLTPFHNWGEENNAVFVENGLWLRPQYYLQPGETDWLEATIREVKAVRSHVGVCDVSTLGKIDIQGPDAAEFLNRVYINAWKKLPVGKARYGVMLREDGIVFDDGTTSRLAENHFLMTTTTANAGPVMTHLEYCHQVLWPGLDVQYMSVTEQWAQMAIAGPHARDVLAKIVDETDMSNEAFPFMAARELMILGGLPARLFRISFSGELAYELAVPADYGYAVWDAVMTAGGEFGITPYGLEALSVLRIEKGHPAGPELDGRTTAADLELGRMMARKKDYVGKTLAARPAFEASDRPRLVGLKPVGRFKGELIAGSHLLPPDADEIADNDQGWLSSSAYSPFCQRIGSDERGCWIALGFVKGGRTRIGEQLLAVDFLSNSEIKVEIVDPVFYDREGKKLHA